MSIVDDTRSSDLYEQLHIYIQSPTEFINHYHDLFDKIELRSSFIDCLCSILSTSNRMSTTILHFILENFIDTNKKIVEEFSDVQFKQQLLPFIKQILLINHYTDDCIRLVLRFLIVLVEYRSNLLLSTLNDWLAMILHFLVTRLSSTSYPIYGQLLIDLLDRIVQHFTPLPKEIVDILGRSPSSIISSTFLTQLKTWIKHVDNTHLALFTIDLWQPLAALLSRLLTRGHTKGNEMLAIIQDAFIVANYSIRTAAFNAWSSFMSHIYRSDDIHQQVVVNRLLKLFLTPFLPDNTSKNTAASIAKCRAWLVLLSAYPTHVDDVLLPFLSFTFKYDHRSTLSNVNWFECRQIGREYLYEYLLKLNSTRSMLILIIDRLLTYLFDAITDELQDSTIDYEQSSWFIQWSNYLNMLMSVTSSISEQQRTTINTCLSVRIEQFWLDHHLSTILLLKLLQTFERVSYPLSLETISTDVSSNDHRMTLADRYLHLLLEHQQRYDVNEPSIDNIYRHLLSYFIECQTKLSDENFCQQISSIMTQTIEPLHGTLVWHCWYRYATHFINMLNRMSTIDTYQHDTLMKLLVQPLTLSDCSSMDYSYAWLWTQLFKSIIRLVQLEQQQQTNQFVFDIYEQLFRQTSIFERTILTENNPRLFGFVLSMMKSLVKDFSIIPSNRTVTTGKCSSSLLTIINTILERIIVKNERTTVTNWHLICCCLTKSTRNSMSNNQNRTFILTYVRDLLIDLVQSCQTSTHVHVLLTHVTYFVSFVHMYEQSMTINGKSSDHVLVQRIFSTMQTFFEASTGSLLLESVYPLFIFAFQHTKILLRTKARKCWNDTFGQLNTLVYPDEFK
jgi:hypothetical protein